jgi:Ca2+-binding RTX toxin-like protein
VGLYVGTSVLVKDTGRGTTHYEDAGSDFINASANSDIILSGGGKDTIFAGGGNDTIDAGKGDDYISATSSAWGGVSGHWGHDTAYGGQGNDVLDFGANMDSVRLFGDDANDTQTGNDRLFGGHAGDTLFGGLGDDQIWGNDGNDVIYGDTLTGGIHGDDKLYGGAGDDIIYGQGGDDTISGGAGVDQMWGGRGDDTFVINRGESGADWAHADVINDFKSLNAAGYLADQLDLGIAGTAHNVQTIHIGTGDTDSAEAKYDQAALWATLAIPNDRYSHSYEFVTDGKDGWLFANHGGHIDYGIELKGVTEFHWENIV